MPDTEQMQEVVYHYTSIETLLKIIEDRHLWATSIVYLNDMLEGVLLVDAARRRLPILVQAGTFDLPVAFPKMPVKPVDAPPEIVGKPFVVSFTSHPDSLMHWRSYCPEQNGVAIGFRTVCLANARIDQENKPGMVVPNIFFEQIRYMEPGNDAQIDEAIVFAYEQTKAFLAQNSGAKEAYEFEFNTLFVLYLETVASVCKHSGFLVEGEYRLVLENVKYRADAMKFRTTRSTLVPYVPLRVPDLRTVQQMYGEPQAAHPFWDAIDHIIVGPSANKHLSISSLEAFLHSRGMKIELRGSEIPYRDW